METAKEKMVIMTGSISGSVEGKAKSNNKLQVGHGAAAEGRRSNSNNHHMEGSSTIVVTLVTGKNKIRNTPSKQKWHGWGAFCLMIIFSIVLYF